MVEHETALATNRKGWNHVAKYFHGSTALPEYGPLAPTEDTLRLLDEPTDACVLELGCGSGHSLRYLAGRGARELWGLDLSSTQIAFAEETLRPFASRVRLIESPMEVNPGIPQNHFDLVFSIYGLGWTTDLPGTMRLVSAYLRPGGSFIVSGEHPAYGCLEWNGTQYAVARPYFKEGPTEHASWKGVPIVIQHQTLATFVGELVRAGLQLEELVETPLDPAAVKPEHVDLRVGTRSRGRRPCRRPLLSKPVSRSPRHCSDDDPRRAHQRLHYSLTTRIPLTARRLAVLE